MKVKVLALNTAFLSALSIVLVSGFSSCIKCGDCVVLGENGYATDYVVSFCEEELEEAKKKTNKYRCY